MARNVIPARRTEEGVGIAKKEILTAEIAKKVTKDAKEDFLCVLCGSFAIFAVKGSGRSHVK